MHSCIEGSTSWARHERSKKATRAKTVLSADGEQVGTIDRVEHGTAYVEADEGLLDELTSMLGDDDGAHTLVGTDVEEVSDDEVRLREDR